MATKVERAALGTFLLLYACSDTQPPVPAQAAGAGGVASIGGGGATGAGTGGGGASGSLAGGAAGSAGVGGAGAPFAGVAGGGQAGAGGAAEPSLNALAQAFHGLRMDLKCHHPQENPCEPQNSATPNRGYLCCYVDETTQRINVPPVDKELTLGGDPTKIYHVELRIRGVMENHDYGGQGTKQGDWVLVGGEPPAPGAIHVFGFTVQDPEETYFFNSWNDTGDPARIIAMDYTVTLPMRGGGKVRVFEYDDIGKIWSNAERLKIEGISPYPEAFDGQFMQVDVVSVKAQP